MEYFWYAVALLALGCVILFIIPDKGKGLFLSLITGISFLLFIPAIIRPLFYNEVISSAIQLPFPLNDTRFEIDALSGFFLFLIGFISFIVSIFSTGYMKTYINEKKSVTAYYFFLSILVLSMVFVVVSRNLFCFLVVWEAMSLSSFFLVIFEKEKKEVISAGINYLIAMHIGFALILSALLIVLQFSGISDFNGIKTFFDNNPGYSIPIFFLFFAGFGMKAGFFPLHTWLPKAHPAAPSPVSALMSGVMIKTGIYGILRVLSLFQNPPLILSYIILLISLFTAGWGIIYAVVEKDMKKVLAYSSIENIGIIGTGIGIGMLGQSYHNGLMTLAGYSGAILHILNHSLFKNALFFGAGDVYLKTHTRNIEKLGGLAKTMPYSAVFFIMSSIAVCGLPPFNGFSGEFIIYLGMLSGAQSGSTASFVISVLSMAVLAFTGAVAIIAFTRVFSIVFLGTKRDEELHVSDNKTSLAMLIPTGFLAILILLAGIFPQVLYAGISNVSKLLAGGDYFNLYFQSLFDLLGKLSNFFLIFLGIFLFIFFIRQILVPKRKTAYYKTWDCGYQGQSPRVQYTANSFTYPFTRIVTYFLKQETKKELPKKIFPKSASFSIEIKDRFEFFVINPLGGWINNVLNLFSWIQTGNTQHYILYGLVFLILAILYAMGASL